LSNNIAIHVEGLSKRYLLGGSEEPYKTLRDTMTNAVAAPVRAVRSAFQRSHSGRINNENEIWALNNVSFEVKRGEVVGIIGRNGAGKSTLLKILSRITDPTKGWADIHGRVGSLLEVGTGFHPELTGRENIYLNGAILGMRRAETQRQFDAMVAFAEVEKFIDTPVKHYSTGMYLRLAFSVAAHVEPEILLVDEVLAVGDIAFQKKCLGKMEEVAAHGRTVLFVSHNMGAIKELCQSCIVISNGRVDFHGPVALGLNHYTQSMLEPQANEALARDTGWRQVRINGQNGGTSKSVQTGQPFFVEAELELLDNFEKVRLYCLVDDSSGNGLVHNFVDSNDLERTALRAGKYQIRAEIPPLWLMPNVYTLYFKLHGRTDSGEEARYLSERVILDVADQTKQSAGKIKATLIPPISWSINK
jgi:lipopolysaccharide transport system ATP-binding protein